MTASRDITGSMLQARAILGWALATVRATLPAAIRDFGRHPDARLFRLDACGARIEAGTRYTSLLGVTSLGEPSPRNAPAAVQLELPEADQYRRLLNLSESAARRGRPALELRLHEFSPVPVDQAEFAFRLLSPLEAGGYQAEVSVVRRDRLREAREALPGDAASWSIVGDVDERGRAGFHYAEGSAKRAGQVGFGPGLLVIILASVLACVAWTDRFTRQAETLELRRVELISFARGLRGTDLDIQRADRARQAGAPTVPLGQVVTALRELGLGEPADLNIQTITLDAPAALVIEGADPDAQGQAANMVLQLPLEQTP